MEINSQMSKTQISFCLTYRVLLAPIKETGNNSPQSHKFIKYMPCRYAGKCLSKGLKYTPTPRSNTIETENDIHNFTRKLRLTEYFANENDITYNDITFTPPRNRNKKLDIVVDYLNNQNFDKTASKNKSDISKNEWEAIKSLKENDSIVIKEADKGGAVVVMNKTHYYSMVVKILQDEVTYKKTNEYCDKKVSKTLKSLLSNLAIVYGKKNKIFQPSFHFQQVTFMIYQSFINLKLFGKPYKFKTVNILKYMNPQI